MKFLNISITAFILILFTACHSHEEGDGHSHEHGEGAHSSAPGHGSGSHEEGGIHLTKEQIKTIDIKFGDFSEMKINDFIRATGTLGLPPNAYSSVSAKSSGFIKNSNKYVEGDFIKKGERIAYLENPEFISQQQKYLEVAAELTFLRQELARQKTLMDADAGILKNVQKLESEVQLKNATLKGIGQQLMYCGIDPGRLTADNITERISILSPMTGYITSINMHNGMYVNPQDELMEVISENHLHLELDVFEKDMPQIKEGQPITYTVPALGNEIFEGDVHVIGREFNTENKTVRIHGHLDKRQPRFIKDLFIDAKIWLNDQTVQALPEKAIIQNGAIHNIYVAVGNAQEDELKFEPIRVIPGNSDKGFTSVKLIDEIPEGMRIVTEGAYYVYAQSMAGELEHSH